MEESLQRSDSIAPVEALTSAPAMIELQFLKNKDKVYMSVSLLVMGHVLKGSKKRVVEEEEKFRYQ
uniref:Uncharacterized protein n=1 Tax=Arundo donax TaxID=35708 RepID=A0A0A9B137_ARUDO